MNNKITMPALVALLALKSGLTKEKSEEFLKEFFKLISDTLKVGESVKIKALGTFKIMSVETRKSINVTNGEEIVIPGHNRIVFVASREIADEINAPFSMFDSVELNPEAEEEIIASINQNEKDNYEELPQTVAKKTLELDSNELKSEIIEEPQIAEGSNEIEETYKPEESNESIELQMTEQEIVSVENKKSEAVVDSEAVVNDESPEEHDSDPDEMAVVEESGRKGKGRMRFVMGFVSGLVVAMLLAAAGYYFFIYNDAGEQTNDNKNVSAVMPTALDSLTNIDSVKEDLAVEVETVNDSGKISEISLKEREPMADTQPSDKVIKDIIGPHNYLTTMAQRHYGDYNLWAYIYEENKSFLGHPDRIKPGTEVVVPPLSKYGIDPKNPEDVKKAKQLGIEIYKRYK